MMQIMLFETVSCASQQSVSIKAHVPVKIRINDDLVISSLKDTVFGVDDV